VSLQRPSAANRRRWVLGKREAYADIVDRIVGWNDEYSRDTRLVSASEFYTEVLRLVKSNEELLTKDYGGYALLLDDVLKLVDKLARGG